MRKRLSSADAMALRETYKGSAEDLAKALMPIATKTGVILCAYPSEAKK